MLVWLLGLSGSGKTTIGTALCKELKAEHPNLFFLDGDIFRTMFDDDIGYSVEARLKNAERISNFCAEMDRQGIHVICAAMALFPKWRQINRTRIRDYFEVYLDIPLSMIEARDPKGIYAAARAGTETNVIGVDIPFPPPTAADLTITKADQDLGVDHCVRMVRSAVAPLLK